MPFHLAVPADLWQAMLDQALAEQPRECCGLLAGLLEGPEATGKPNLPVGRVVARYPLVNELASPTRYRSEAASLLAAHKDMRARGLDLLAVYHSHPTSAPVPSRTDLAENFYGDTVVHLIVTLTTAPPTVRGWWLSETSYREAEFEVVG